MAITTIQCADCGATVAGWIARGDTASICFQCNDRRLARWVCADQINGLEARIAALETDLRVAAVLMFKIQENHGSVCASCIPAIQAVLSRPGVAALREEPHDGR